MAGDLDRLASSFGRNLGIDERSSGSSDEKNYLNTQSGKRAQRKRVGLIGISVLDPFTIID